jgi:hypothetical protein
MQSKNRNNQVIFGMDLTLSPFKASKVTNLVLGLLDSWSSIGLFDFRTFAFFAVVFFYHLRHLRLQTGFLDFWTLGLRTFAFLVVVFLPSKASKVTNWVLGLLDIWTLGLLDFGLRTI